MLGASLGGVAALLWCCIDDLFDDVAVEVVLLLLNTHLEQHFLLGQVLLLRCRLGNRLPVRRRLLLLLLSLVLLNLLHEHDLLLFRELLGVLLARARHFHCVLIAARRHHVS